MPWHPFPLFSISSFPFWRAREMSRPVWLSPGWDTGQKLPTHFYVPTGLEVLCLPGHFLFPRELPTLPTQKEPGSENSDSWQDINSCSNSTEDRRMNWDEAGKPREARKWALSFGVGPPSRLEGALPTVKKKRKKRKREADERGRKLGRKKIKEGKAEKEVGQEGREEKRETWRKVAVLAHEELIMHPAQGFTYIMYFNVYNSL